MGRIKNRMNQDEAITETVIDPVQTWGFPSISEVFEYRDLLYFLVWRTVKVAYAQSVGGFAWAIIQPALQIFVFTIVFGGLLDIDTEGVPYPLLATVAVIPWTYMSGVMTLGSNSLVSNAGMLGKVYFPRLIYLLLPSIAGLISFFISLVLIVAVLIYYRQPLTINIFMLPVVFLMMLVTPFAISLWLSSLTIRFRDFKIMIGQLVRVVIYFVPVMYPSSQIAPEWRSLYILNPFVGVIEGYRSVLLGDPFYWDSLTMSIGVSMVLLITGAVYFRRMERVVVDVI
jgi:lipopolysaccharide transport system permease protein